jgi:nicotinamide mononucleotide adenylyltransferase
MILQREIVEFEGRLVEVIRSFRESNIKNLEEIKKWLDADTVLRKHDRMYFCKTIHEIAESDIEILTDNVPELINN